MLHIDPRDLFYYGTDPNIFTGVEAYDSLVVGTHHERLACAVAGTIEHMLRQDGDALDRAVDALKELRATELGPTVNRERAEAMAVLRGFFLARHDPPRAGDPRRRCRVKPYGSTRCDKCEACREPLV